MLTVHIFNAEPGFEDIYWLGFWDCLIEPKGPQYCEGRDFFEKQKQKQKPDVPIVNHPG